MNFKQLGFQKLSELQVVVVDKLYYKYFLKGRESTSKKRFECSCLLQGHTLYVTRAADSHSIFMELSRIFFNGSTELLFANFLHMVTTMTESGSSYEQIEFFIANSQKIPKLVVEDPIWCLSFSSEPGLESQHQAISSSVNTEQNAPMSKRKSGVQNWPPTDWKTAPDKKFAKANYHLTKPGTASSAFVSTESGKLTDGITCLDQPVLVDVDEAWLTEASPATTTAVLQDSAMTDKQPISVASLNSVGIPIYSGGEPEKELDEYIALSRQTVDDIRQRTGRMGELVAYRYFTEKLGLGNVKWVNEETETGLPYDLIIGNDESSREYIEVKATAVAKKKWFMITLREWQFAAKAGDAYSIAHVVLLESKKAGVTVLKNPLKLCQQNVLKLALFISDEPARMV